MNYLLVSVSVQFSIANREHTAGHLVMYKFHHFAPINSVFLTIQPPSLGAAGQERHGDPCSETLRADGALPLTGIDPFARISNTPRNHGLVGDFHTIGTIFRVFNFRGVGFRCGT